MITAFVVALMLCASASATPTPDPPPPMGWETFQARGWDKFHDSNDMLRARCRERFAGMEAFAGKTLREVLPGWRRTKLERLNDKRARQRAKASLCWPAHHSLWLCIHSREGDWEDGGWPYWGGLQMGDWFLETFMGIHDPQGSVGPNGWQGAPSQYAQEAAAEAGYRGSGYSLAWLHGQWPNTAPPCDHLA